MGTRLSTRHVRRSRNSIRRSYSATTRALVPSGVKYRLYGLGDRIVPARFPVTGSITSRAPEPGLSTYRWRRSQDGVTWWGSPPTTRRRITRYVWGSISSTVPFSVFGTYTRSGIPATLGLKSPAPSPAYRSTGPPVEVGAVGRRAGATTSD